MAEGHLLSGIECPTTDPGMSKLADQPRMQSSCGRGPKAYMICSSVIGQHAFGEVDTHLVSCHNVTNPLPRFLAKLAHIVRPIL